MVDYLKEMSESALKTYFAMKVIFEKLSCIVDKLNNLQENCIDL